MRSRNFKQNRNVETGNQNHIPSGISTTNQFFHRNELLFSQLPSPSLGKEGSEIELLHNDCILESTRFGETESLPNGCALLYIQQIHCHQFPRHQIQLKLIKQKQMPEILFIIFMFIVTKMQQQQFKQRG